MGTHWNQNLLCILIQKWRSWGYQPQPGINSSILSPEPTHRAMPWHGLNSLPTSAIFLYTPWISHVQCAGIRTLETSSLFLRKHSSDYKREWYTKTAQKKPKYRIWKENIEWNVKRQQDFPELQTSDHLKGKESKACPFKSSSAIPHSNYDPSKFSG